MHNGRYFWIIASRREIICLVSCLALNYFCSTAVGCFNLTHIFLTDWVYSLIRDLQHAGQTNETILLLICCMYTLINDPVALSFAVNPSRVQKALEVGCSPFQLKESVLSPLLNSSWSLFILPIVSYCRTSFTWTKASPPKLPPLPRWLLSCHVDWPWGPAFSKTGILSCFWVEFWKVWGKLHILHTDRMWFGS